MGLPTARRVGGLLAPLLLLSPPPRCLAGRRRGPTRREVYRQQERNKSFHLRSKMPACNFSPEKYESYPYEHMVKIRKENISPSLYTSYKKPLLIHQGHMQWLFDLEGRRYLDLFAGIVTVGVGHCHPKVTAAAQKQLGRLWHTSNLFMHPGIQEYAEKLASLFPDPLKVIYLTNSGSEANDLAMLMARLFTRNFDIISLRGSYHGGTACTMGMTSLSHYKHVVANGLGCQTTMLPDVFRGPWGGSHCRDSPVQTIRKCSCSPDSCHAKDQYIEQLKDTFRTCVPKAIAGFIAEPIQGVNGAVQYPKGFLKEAFQLVREKGGVCIVDEVQTGFGRIGSHFWGFEGHDVVPDIVTMAKGIGNGFPMAAVVTRAGMVSEKSVRKEMDVLDPDFVTSQSKASPVSTAEKKRKVSEIANALAQSTHFNTYGGNAVACAVGSAVLEAIAEDGLQKNCEDVGTHMLLEFAKLRNEFEIVGDVRGKGLMIGIEMVENKETRQPLPREEVAQISEDCKDMGVIIGQGGLHLQTFRIKPPMCITKEDADFAVEVFHAALTRHMERKAAANQHPIRVCL